MRRLLPLALLSLIALPALAAEPVTANTTLDALDNVCGTYLTTGDYDAYRAEAAASGLMDFGGVWVRRSKGADLLVTAGTADPPMVRTCTAALDADPDTTSPLSGMVYDWAKAHGLKPKGKATSETGEDGKPYIKTVWKGPKATLQMNETIKPGAARINVTLIWSVK